VAAWFGLVMGLVEGVERLGFQHLGWLTWDVGKLYVSSPIVWISTLVDLAIAVILGLALLVLAQIFRRVPALRLAVFLFSFLAFYDWLGVIGVGRIRHLGIIGLSLGVAAVFTRWFTKHQVSILRFWRRTLPWVATGALLVLIGIQAGNWLQERMALARLPQPAPDSPNVLVIVVDALRADHLGAYGYARETSPNIDRLAHQGVLFENAIATSSWTFPSHTSMLTGRYPHELGVMGPGRYDGRYPTLGQALEARGYRTGAFSANTFFFCRAVGLGRGFIHFEDYFGSIQDMAARTFFGEEFDGLFLQRLGFEDVPGRKRAPEVDRETIRWLARNSGRPFFAFLNYFDVHDPYLPPQPYRSRFSKLKKPGGIINTWVLRNYPRLTPEQLQGEVDAYDGGIAYADHSIGQLLAELARHDLERNTLVIITSDHGESFGEHGLLTHRNALYREVIHVPLIFWWPGHLPADVRVSTPISTTELPATIMQLVGVREEKEFPAPSLAKLWSAPNHGAHWQLPMSELAHMGFEPKQNPLRYGAMKSLVSLNWQYILHSKFGAQLYDWQNDPGELHNLAGTPEGQGIVRQLSEQLQEILAHSGDKQPDLAWVRKSADESRSTDRSQ
jgi:arylsulfatase A-like enzyme